MTAPTATRDGLLLVAAFASGAAALTYEMLWTQLLALSLGCTLLPFALALRALRHTSAFTAQLAVSLEPVYAIVLAIVLAPYLPETAPQILAALGQDAGLELERARSGQTGPAEGIAPAEPLFPRVDAPAAV